MEDREVKRRELDFFMLLGDFLREARGILVLGLTLVVVCASGIGTIQRVGYEPCYEACASFSVHLTEEQGGKDAATAKQMAKIIPPILTSDILRQRVIHSLGTGELSGTKISAGAEAGIITLVVADSDPERAMDVLEALLEIMPEIAEYAVGPITLVMLDESGIPQEPANPYNLLDGLVGGGLVGILLWVVMAGVLALSKNTVHREEELPLLLGCDCLGWIHPGWEEVIPLRLEKQLQSGNPRVLLITSAIEGEGKSDAAMTVAESLAKAGRRVLLMDWDFRSSSVTKKPGLSDCLEGTIPVREMICSTNQKNLYVASAGCCPDVKIFREQTEKLLDVCGKLFDYVILELPPCSMMGDAADLVEQADWGLLAVRKDYASRDQILDGVQYLWDCNLKGLSCVMTQPGSGVSGKGIWEYDCSVSK